MKLHKFLFAIIFTGTSCYAADAAKKEKEAEERYENCLGMCSRRFLNSFQCRMGRIEYHNCLQKCLMIYKKELKTGRPVATQNTESKPKEGDK